MGTAEERTFAIVGLLLLATVAWGQTPEPPLLRLPLAGQAATHFATTDPAEPGHAPLAGRLAAVRPDLTWSPCLARAAVSFAATTAGRRAEFLPPDLLEAVLLHTGCPDPYAEVGTVITSGDGAAAAVALARQLDAAAAMPFTHVGLGGAAEASGRTRWAVVLSRRLAEVEAFPARCAAGSAQVLRFRPVPGLDQPQAAVIGPDGNVQRPPVVCGPEGCETEIAAGHRAGAIWVQLAARHGKGTVLAAQLRAGVDVDPPTHWEGFPLADPEPPVTAPEGEAGLARLVNAERQRHGLSPLASDPALAVVARAHSADMRDAGFFAHRSPTRGDLMERLETAGYPVRAARENLARGSGVAAAHAALMMSPGHRANLLWPEMTHLGVGAVRTDGGNDAGSLTITQILAVPAARPSAADVREQVLGRVVAVRERVGREPLRRDERLDRWAERAATRAARRGTFDPGWLAELEAELGPPQEGSRTVRAELLTASEPALLDVPEAVAGAGTAALGIGVALAEAAEGGPMVTVVLVVVETFPNPVSAQPP